MALFIVCFQYTDEIKLCLACLSVSHAGTCVQILRQSANFGEIFARCARLQILNQIFENPCLGQRTRSWGRVQRCWHLCGICRGGVWHESVDARSCSHVQSPVSLSVRPRCGVLVCVPWRVLCARARAHTAHAMAHTQAHRTWGAHSVTQGSGHGYMSGRQRTHATRHPDISHRGASIAGLGPMSVCVGPDKDFRRFDSKFAGARSAQKFLQNLLTGAKSAHMFPHVRRSGTQDRV